VRQLLNAGFLPPAAELVRIGFLQPLKGWRTRGLALFGVILVRLYATERTLEIGPSLGLPAFDGITEGTTQAVPGVRMRATNICLALSLAFGCVEAIPPSIAAETTTDPEQVAATLACGSWAASTQTIADAGATGVARPVSLVDASNTGVPAGATFTRHHADYHN
jgi:hypothetical protein